MNDIEKMIHEDMMSQTFGEAVADNNFDIIDSFVSNN